MKVESKDKTIEEVLQANYLQIPRFQRPFSWGVDHLSDFWDDVILERDPDYFLGSIVLFPGPNKVLQIVDGQQRLTTVTILLAALRDEFQSIEEEDFARGTQLFIERPNKNNKLQFVLKTQTSYPFFQSRVQSVGETDSPAAGPEEEAIDGALNFFRGKIAAVRSTMLPVDSPPSSVALENFSTWLQEARDLVLSTNVIEVRVAKEDDAYVIFETLNTRGLDLGLSDLVRNFVLRGMTTANDELDLARDTFNGVLDLLHSAGRPIDVDSFLYHQWVSREKYTAKKKTFRAIKKSTKPAEKADYLKLLESDAKLYRAILDVEFRSWPREANFVPAAFAATGIFDMALPFPLFLSLLRAYDAGIAKIPVMKRALHAVESFHFLGTAVVGKSSSGGLAKMYAAYARGVAAAADNQEVSEKVGELISALRDRKPARDEFSASFAELRFSSEYTKDKRLVQYALGKILAASPEGDQIGDSSHLTIEHIAPERPRSASSIPFEAVERIGNLILVSEKLNSESLGNKPFTKKLPILRSAPGVHLDEVLDGAKVWTRKAIAKRTDHLAGIAYDSVWKF